MLRIEALDSERQAVDARRVESVELLALESSRVGFQRDLGVRERAGLERGTSARSRSIAPAEKRLGVPPPMNTEKIRRPQIDGNANSRSATSAST
jgi:hypothetical protein